MRTVLHQAVRRSLRRENYLMERRMHEIQEAQDQEDQVGETEDKEDQADKTESG